MDKKASNIIKYTLSAILAVVLVWFAFRTVDWKTCFVAKPLVGIDILDTFNIVGHEALQVSFNGIFTRNNVVELLLFSLGEILHPSGRLYFSRRKDGFA